MNLRDLINKLDSFEQKELLKESESLMEKVRIRYDDVEAVANKYKDDEDKRLAALTQLIKDNNLPGLFDPIKKELVKPDGTYAWFAGANEETVKRLEQWGLLPPEAKTSSWLGTRGEDPETAMPANAQARSRDQMVDRAEALMKKAVASATEKTTSIQESLLESFGLEVALLEAITPAEHTELKKLVKQLEPFAKTDPDSADIMSQYKAYIEKRNALIARINELIAILKSKKPVQKESLQESKARMIAEGRVQILEEGKRYLRDGLEWTYDPTTKLYSHIKEDGTVEQLDEDGFWQGVGDFGRGMAVGATAGGSDILVAGVKSLFKGTKYSDELKKELATTELVKKRSPWLFHGGAFAGAVANPAFTWGTWGLGGLATYFGVQYLTDKHKTGVAGDQSVNASPSAPAPLPFNKTIQQMQQELLAQDPKSLPKFGADGKLGQETVTALMKYPAIAEKYKATLNAVSKPVMQANQGNIGKRPEGADALVAQLITQLGLPNGASDKQVADAVVNAANKANMSVGDYIAKLSTTNESQLNEFIGQGIKFVSTILKGAPEAVQASKAPIGAMFKDAEGVAFEKWATGWRNLKTGRIVDKPLQAQVEKEFLTVSNQTVGATSAKAGAELSTATKGSTTASEAGLISRYGTRAKTAFERIKIGKFASFAKNHKFMTLVAILSAAGYILNSDGSVEGDVNPSPTNPASSNTPGKQEEAPELIELRKLLSQLNGGWPTDAETAAVNKSAEEVGAKPEAGREGSGASPSEKPTPANASTLNIPAGGSGMSQQQISDIIKAKMKAAASAG